MKKILITGAVAVTAGILFMVWCCCRAAAKYDHEFENLDE